MNFKPSSLDMKTALTITLKNRPFLTYLSAQIFFFMGITMSGPAIPYFARVILGRDEGFAAILSLTMLPGILLGFYAIQHVVDRIGTRNTLAVSVFFLGLAHIPYGFLTPSTPDAPHDLFNLAIVFTLSGVKGLGIAGMMILPTVLLGQLIDLDETRTSAGRSAMYYGVQGLMTKWVYAASAAIMSYLLSAYGRSADEPLGVLLIGPVAGVLCLVSAGLYLLYPEKQVHRESAL